MDDPKRLTADEMLQHPWVAVSVHNSCSLNSLITYPYFSICIHRIRLCGVTVGSRTLDQMVVGSIPGRVTIR